MSRVGKMPIELPDKVQVTISGRTVTVKGPKGELVREIHPSITAELQDKTVVVTRPNDLKKNRALHGLTRSLINNMVLGVKDEFKRELQIIGVGYRAEMKGKLLVMQLGYSHPILFNPPDGIAITVLPKENKIFVQGIDKEVVGAVAAKIRSFRKPEPYKGKGVRYAGEHVKIKAGKTGAA